MPALRCPQDVARPSYLQVPHRNAETRTKLGGLEDSLEATLCLRGKALTFTIKEISKKTKIDQMACFNVMLHWIERGMIEHKLIGKQYYYTLKRG